MIPPTARVYVSLSPVDLRKGFDSLSGLVRESLESDVRDGSVYVFLGKRQDRLKALYYDASGVCILYKRLHRGRFSLPTAMRANETSVTMSELEFERMFSGAVMRPMTQSTKKRALSKKRTVH